MTHAAPASEPSASAPDAARPTCACGHDRSHYLVSAKGKYTAFGWFTVLFGITTHPVAVDYVCRRCGEVVEHTEAEEDLQAHIGSR